MPYRFSDILDQKQNSFTYLLQTNTSLFLSMEWPICDQSGCSFHLFSFFPVVSLFENRRWPGPLDWTSREFFQIRERSHWWVMRPHSLDRFLRESSKIKQKSTLYFMLWHSSPNMTLLSWTCCTFNNMYLSILTHTSFRWFLCFFSIIFCIEKLNFNIV